MNQFLIFLLFCKVLCLVTISMVQSLNIYSMPLIRRNSPLKMLINDPHYMEKLQVQKKRPMNENITLFKYLDSEYYADILVGKPGKKFTVIFDTTWGDMWLPSKLCSPVLFPICEKKHVYDANGSSTHIPIDPKPFNVSGLVGSLTCDTVRLAHLNVSDLKFAEIKEIHNVSDYGTMHADGVIGLGYKSLAYTTDYPFFYKLLAEKKILKPIFSLYMNRDVTSRKGGTIFLGGVNRKHIKGEITYLPVIEKKYWKIEMNQFSVQINKTNAQTFCTGLCQVVVDSSNNMIGVPKDKVATINSLIGAVEYLHNRYMVPCLKVAILPTITLNFGGTDFHIKGRHYVQKIENENDGTMVCITAFCDAHLPDGLWSLGGAFLSSVYTTFDIGKNQIGFANLT